MCEDIDVTTEGTLVGALNFGGTEAVVNGVVFAPFAPVGNSTTVGNFTLSASGAITSRNVTTSAGEFDSLSLNYRGLVGTAASRPNMEVTLGMIGLVVGQSYLFQTWASNPFDWVGYPLTVTAGNSVSLLPNTSPSGAPFASPGLGQYVIGTFTADAPTQSVTFLANEVSVMNGFQLRAIPEPATGALGLAALTTLALRRRSRRSA
jgi:MYXO-CTERM domain-containing protein